MSIYNGVGTLERGRYMQYILSCKILAQVGFQAYLEDMLSE